MLASNHVFGIGPSGRIAHDQHVGLLPSRCQARIRNAMELQGGFDNTPWEERNGMLNMIFEEKNNNERLAIIIYMIHIDSLEIESGLRMDC